MRKLFLFMMVSLDGYFEGSDHDLSWHNADNKEFNDFAIEQTEAVGTILFGRATYMMMQEFWTSAFAIKTDPIVTEQMNTTPKIVFSHSLDKADWKNTRLAKDAAATVRQLKQTDGKALAIFGSNNLCVSLMVDNLVDEFRIMVNPIALGHGTPLFAGLQRPVPLKLCATRQFKSGNILLSYQLRADNEAL